MKLVFSHDLSEIEQYKSIEQFVFDCVSFLSVCTLTGSFFSLPSVEQLNAKFIFSPRYNGTDLMWSDATTNLRILSDAEQRLPRLFGPNLYATLHDIPGCPATSLRLCVVGRMELDKCTAFQLALQSRNLKPPLGCVPAPHHWACMSLIAAGHADVMVCGHGVISNFLFELKFNQILILFREA